MVERLESNMILSTIDVLVVECDDVLAELFDGVLGKVPAPERP